MTARTMTTAQLIPGSCLIYPAIHVLEGTGFQEPSPLDESITFPANLISWPSSGHGLVARPRDR